MKADPLGKIHSIRLSVFDRFACGYRAENKNHRSRLDGNMMV